MASVTNLFGNNLLSLADARMVYSERRTAILAQDIANADTPGFVARDLPDFASLLQGMRLAPASSGASLQQPRTAPHARRVPGPMTPDGNAVDVEQTLAKLADTDSAQRLASEIYSKYLNFYRIAVGR
jgi:flagellar basal-body rod protein FlgB